MATLSRRVNRLRTDDEDLLHTTSHTISQIDWKNFRYRDLIKATLTHQEAQKFARTLALIDCGPVPALVRTAS